MADVTVRPSRAEDFAAFVPSIPGRVISWTGEHEGEILGLGGLQFLSEGTVGVFTYLTDAARKHPVLLHKTAKAFLAEVQRRGFTKVVALADTSQPAAERWLLRLGFERTLSCGQELFVWQTP